MTLPIHKAVKVKNSFLFLSFLLVITSCGTLEKDLKASKECNVWKRQKFLRPMSIKVQNLKTIKNYTKTIQLEIRLEF